MTKKYRVKVRQNYVAVRETVMLVRASCAEEAQENVASGSIDLPSFDSPKWRTGWDLQSESCEVLADNPSAFVTHR